jgi:hypothetical protein
MSAKTTHSISELQAILSEQIDLIAAGETTPAKANAVVNATAAILRPLAMQMAYAKAVGKTPHIPMLMTGEES